MKFHKEAVEWLKERGFKVDEIREAETLLAENLMRETVLLPRNVSERVAALVYAVHSTKDVAVERSWITLPEETKRAFEEEAEIEALESELPSKIKSGRAHSKAKRRSSVKKERY